MRTAFVTGASGHVGANLIRLLVKKNWNVRCLIHNDLRAFEGVEIEKVQGDLLDERFLYTALKDCYAVFHAAAHIDIENIDVKVMKKVNVNGTKALTRAALKANVKKFIHFSSIHAFEQTPTDTELDELRPLVSKTNAASYDLSKADSERVVQEAFNKGLKTVIINPTGILGPFDYKPSRMGQLISNISKKKMKFTLNTGFDWVDVRDVCETAIQCVDQGKPGQSYILSGRWVSFKELSKIVGTVIKENTHWVSLPFWTAYLCLPFAFIYSKISGHRPSISRGSLHALAVQPLKISNKKASKELNYNPRSIEITIKDTIKWNRDYDN